MAKVKDITLKGLKLSFKRKSISFDINGISEEIDMNIAKDLACFDGIELTKDEEIEEKKKEDKKVVNKVIDEEKQVNYNDLTVSEIKKILDEKEIKYQSKLNKEELIKLID